MSIRRPRTVVTQLQKKGYIEPLEKRRQRKDFPLRELIFHYFGQLIFHYFERTERKYSAILSYLICSIVIQGPFISVHKSRTYYGLLQQPQESNTHVHVREGEPMKMTEKNQQQDQLQLPELPGSYSGTTRAKARYSPAVRTLAVHKRFLTARREAQKILQGGAVRRSSLRMGIIQRKGRE